MMQGNLGSSIEALVQIQSTFGSMDEEQKKQFQSLFKDAGSIPKEDFSRNLANFLNVVEATQFLKIWIKIAEIFGVDYTKYPKNSTGSFDIETKIGRMTLVNKDFIELSCSTIELAKKLLGSDISFPQQTMPKIFKEMTEDYHAETEGKNDFHLHALIGEAKIKVIKDKCTVFLSTSALSRDFLARIYLNLRLNNEEI